MCKFGSTLKWNIAKAETICFYLLNQCDYIGNFGLFTAMSCVGMYVLSVGISPSYIC